MALEVIHDSLLHVLEYTTLKQALTIGVTLNGMAIVVLPCTAQVSDCLGLQGIDRYDSSNRVLLTDAVDRMEQGAAGQSWRPSGRMVDVVVLEGDLVICPYQLNGPVMVCVTPGGPFCVSVNVVVGQGNPVTGVSAENIMLAAQVLGSDVVDPNQVGARECESITAPDVLGIPVRDDQLLDDEDRRSWFLELLTGSRF